MSLTFNNCDILHDSNTWQSKTTEEIEIVARIIALYANLDKIKYVNLKLVQYISNKVTGNKKSKYNKNDNK